MGIVADDDRTGYGLAALKSRYRRRMDTLREDVAFRADMDSFRSAWNREFPRYTIERSDNSESGMIPPRLIEAINENVQQAESLFHTLREDTGLSEEKKIDLANALGRRLTDLLPRSALAFWMTGIRLLADKHFRLEDFPDPYPPEGDVRAVELRTDVPPAHLFVAMSIQTDPRLIDVEQLIDSISWEHLRPVSAVPALDPRTGTLTDVQYVFPDIPGLTAKDTGDEGMARRMNAARTDRTLAARVLALSEEGLSQRQIVERLGSTPPTVSGILKRTRVQNIPKS